MAIPVLYWMLECSYCGTRLVVHDSFLEFVGGPDCDEGEGYGDRPLPERHGCSKGCSGPMRALGSIFRPEDEEMWLFEPHVPIAMTRAQRDEWSRLIQNTGIAPDIEVASATIRLKEIDPAAHPKEKDLEGHLSNGTAKEAEEPVEDSDKNMAEDFQLQRALDLLKSWDIFHKIKSTASIKAAALD